MFALTIAIILAVASWERNRTGKGACAGGESWAVRRGDRLRPCCGGRRPARRNSRGRQSDGGGSSRCSARPRAARITRFCDDFRRVGRLKVRPGLLVRAACVHGAWQPARRCAFRRQPLAASKRKAGANFEDPGQVDRETEIVVRVARQSRLGQHGPALASSAVGRRRLSKIAQIPNRLRRSAVPVPRDGQAQRGT